jgi:integrase
MQARQGVPKPSGTKGVGAKGFTATRVATLPAGRYKDPGQRSLYLQVRARIGDKPSRTWLHRIKAKGGDTYLQVGHFPETSLEAARDIIRQQRELLSKGIDPKRAAPRRRTVRSAATLSSAALGNAHSIETLAQEFVERFIRANHKRPEYAEAILAKHVLPEWAGRDSRSIRPREVIELLDKVVGSGKRVMANKVAALLGQLFKFGVHRAIVESSPVQLLMRPGGKEKPRSRALSDEELAAFLKDPLACTRQARLSSVITVLLATAARRGELTLARWRDIDFTTRTWTVPAENAKTGIACIVPLSDIATTELRKLANAAGKSPWVLPGSDPARPLEPRLLTRGLAKCLTRFKKQGVAAFTLHDLRRTCRTGLARLKVQPHVAELCLNHKQPGIAGVYDVHDYESEKRAALEKWAVHLQALATKSC